MVKGPRLVRNVRYMRREGANDFGDLPGGKFLRERNEMIQGSEYNPQYISFT